MNQCCLVCVILKFLQYVKMKACKNKIISIQFNSNLIGCFSAISTDQIRQRFTRVVQKKRFTRVVQIENDINKAGKVSLFPC